jgi:sucrose-6-phosphate hydrolase SacC (GH32 family)
MIFSGSAVVDWKNTSGFGGNDEPPLVAIYTGHYTERPLQNQHIAYSTDRGRTWTKYAGNPVLDVGARDFRDPKVMWHEPTGKWVMTVTMPVDRKLRFYGSPNLKDWTFLSEFGPAGAVRGIWECPDLFPLRIEGSRREKWVLIVNIGGESVAGGSGCQYFVGEFDGETFVEDPPVETASSEPPSVEHAFMDFEGDDYGDWLADGDAFGDVPANGTLDGQQAVSGFRGRGLVNTFLRGDATTGTLTSPEFTIEMPRVNFLIGGGRHPGETGMSLVVDGEVVRTATGRDDERLDWHSWDVSNLRGQTARLQIFDRHTGGWGHINVDHILFSREARQPADESVNWVDYGKDFYAAVSWSEVPKRDGRRLWLGWMSNWQYANDAPTSPWRGAMSIPRSLGLRPVEGDLRLVQTPVRELKRLRGDRERIRIREAAGEIDLSAFADPANEPFELEMEMMPGQDAVFELELRTGADEAVTLRVDLPRGRLSLDRRHSGRVDFSDQFPAVFEAPIRLIDGRLNLLLYVDTSSIEVFVNDGETVISSLLFATGPSRAPSLVVKEGVIHRGDLQLWALESSWR